MHVRFEGRIAQKFEVQAGRPKLWWCHDSGTQRASGVWKEEKRVVGGSLPITDADAFAAPSQDHIREHKNDEEWRGGGGVMTLAVLLTHVAVIRSVPC
jgi:hypothetical protein